MKDSLLDVSYNIFNEIAKKGPGEIDIFFSEREIFPKYETSAKPKVTIPLPRTINDKSVFLDMIFQDYEQEHATIWNLYLASLCHMSTHARLTDYEIYSEWKKSKTPQVTQKIINHIEDIKVNNFLSSNFPEYWESISEINKQYEKISETQLKLNTNQYSSSRFAEQFGLEKIEKRQELESLVVKNIKDNSIVLELADFMYENRSLLSQVNLPYTESNNSQNKITYRENISIKPIGVFRNTSKILDEIWVDSIIKKQKTMKKYEKFAKGLNFDTVEFAPENYSEYLQLKNESSMLLKKLRSQLQMVSNVVDVPNPEDIGMMEMQKAIQAVASQNDSIQVFEQDEARRSDENWAIVMDTSLSMKLKFHEMKKFALCLSETADEISSRGGKWGMFCFNSKFSIVKDQGEKYRHEAKSRIGGIDNSGLSFIPDAITMATRILEEDLSDKKFIFLITDGQSLGYPQIEEYLKDAITYARKQGINVIGIGLPDGIARYFTISIPQEELRKTVSKFISAYVEIAQSGM